MILPDQILRATLTVLEAVTAIPVLYLLAVSVAAIRVTGKRAGNVVPPPGRTRRFAILVPAHDEEAVLGELLESLRELEYPHDSRCIYVIADNCTDRTAEVARNSGIATVLQRFDGRNRGKGHALSWAIRQIQENEQEKIIDAFIVFDADSVVDPRFLQEMNNSLATGAVALQGNNAVLNTADSPSTVMRWLALTLMNHVRQLGRNTLGSSAALTGNGMCLSNSLLQRLPWRAFSVSEDYQYYLMLVSNGESVRYVPQALVRSRMPTSFEQMRTQDIRWESADPDQPTWKTALKILRSGLDWTRIETVLELLTPPLSLLTAGTIGLLLWANILLSPLHIGAALGLFAGIVLHVGTGLWFMKPDRGAWRALMHIPRYALWKLWVICVLSRRRKYASNWVRTSRSATE